MVGQKTSLSAAAEMVVPRTTVCQVCSLDLSTEAHPYFHDIEVQNSLVLQYQVSGTPGKYSQLATLGKLVFCSRPISIPLSTDSIITDFIYSNFTVSTKD